MTKRRLLPAAAAVKDGWPQRASPVRPLAAAALVSGRACSAGSTETRATRAPAGAVDASTDAPRCRDSETGRGWARAMASAPAFPGRIPELPVAARSWPTIAAWPLPVWVSQRAARSSGGCDQAAGCESPAPAGELRLTRWLARVRYSAPAGRGGNWRWQRGSTCPLVAMWACLRARPARLRRACRCDAR